MNIFRHCVLFLVLLLANNAWAQPSLEIPSAGATLAADEQLFDWSGSSQLADDWWLYVGTVEGGKQYFDSGLMTESTSANVSALPTDGSTVYVRLWHRKTSQSWQFVDTSYSAANVTTKPLISSPGNDSTLSGSTVTFSFDSNGTRVDDWWLYVGSSVGGVQYANSGNLGRQASVTVNNLPTGGEDVHARLWYRTSGGPWNSVDSMYAASYDANRVEPYFVLPAPGNFVADQNQVFEWVDNGVNADEWWLFIGSSKGKNDYLNSGLLVDCTSFYVSALPANISTVYVTLWYRSAGQPWKRMDTQF